MSSDAIILKNSTLYGFDVADSYNSVIVGELYKEPVNYVLPLYIYSSAVYYSSTYYASYSQAVSVNSTFDNVTDSVFQSYSSGPISAYNCAFLYSQFGIDDTTGVRVKYVYDRFNEG